MWESAEKLVKKEIIRSGDFGDKPTERAVCNISIENVQSREYTTKQIKENCHSKIIEEPWKKSIVMGDACSVVDRYIERAIQTMNLSEQSLFTLQIPKNDKETAVISLEITLKSIEFHKPIWKWSADEKYKVAFQYKEKGVELFKAKRYKDAFHKFSKACKIIITLEPIDQNDKNLKKHCDLKYILYNNMAECHLNNNNYEYAITLCNKVLVKDANNIKALYRRGIAYGYLKDYEKAINDLKSVINKEPMNKKAQEKFNIYNEKWHASVQGYESMVRKMFKG